MSSLDPSLLRTPTQLLDLERQEAQSIGWEHGLESTAVDFDPSAECPRWEQFLVDCLGETGRDFMQRALGYSLTGYVHERCAFVLYGPGHGKSTVLRILSNMLDNWSATFPKTRIAASVALASVALAPVEMSDLINRRVVTCDESTQIPASMFKSMVDGDTFEVRRLFTREVFHAPMRAKLWIISDDTDAKLFRGMDSSSKGRIRAVHFERVLDADHMNHHLMSELRRELPGIFAWAVRGVSKWKATGLCHPA